MRDQHDIVLKVFLQALLNVLPLETVMPIAILRQIYIYPLRFNFASACIA